MLWFHGWRFSVRVVIRIRFRSDRLGVGKEFFDESVEFFYPLGLRGSEVVHFTHILLEIVQAISMRSVFTLVKEPN